MYGITNEGFRKKPYHVIRSEIEAQFIEAFGNINTAPETPEGQLIDIMAEQEYSIWELEEDNFFSQYPRTAEGVPLDFSVSLNGIKRNNATRTFLKDVHLFGTAGDLILQGTELYIPGDSGAVFETLNDVTLQTGTRQILTLEIGKVPVSGSFALNIENVNTSDIFWDAGQKHVERLDFSAEPASGTFQIDINGVNTNDISYNASASDIQTAINNLSFIDSCKVTDVSGGSNIPAFEITLSYLNYDSVIIENNSVEDSSSSPVSLSFSNIQIGEKRAGASDIEQALNNSVIIDNAEVSDTTTGNDISFEITLDYADLGFSLNSNSLLSDSDNSIIINLFEKTQGVSQGKVDVQCRDFGSIVCSRYKLTGIVDSGNPLDRTINFLEGETGKEIEDDIDLKLRRQEALSNFASGTVNGVISELAKLSFLDSVNPIENETRFFVGNRPPKSFETFVVPNKTLTSSEKQQIANSIFRKKPIGIQAFGEDESITVYDSQNKSHTIEYSYPNKIDIYIILDVTKEDYITDFSALREQIVNRTLDYGNNIGVGKDVIVNPYFVGALSEIEGMKDVIIKISKSPGPTTDNNILIDDGENGAVEVSNWIESNITVNIV